MATAKKLRYSPTEEEHTASWETGADVDYDELPAAEFDEVADVEYELEADPDYDEQPQAEFDEAAQPDYEKEYKKSSESDGSATGPGKAVVSTGCFRPGGAVLRCRGSRAPPF